MKKKSIMTVAAATVMAAAMSMSALAGEVGWTHDYKGWWYGTDEIGAQWYNDGWHWLDGNNDGMSECYYFGADGYMLINTTTPDGYAVNGDGAWTVNGVVQTQGMLENNNATTNATQTSNGDIALNSDNGGYNNYGCSNAALDMFKNTREDNTKYGEVKIDTLSLGTCTIVTYANGFKIFYPYEGSAAYKRVAVSEERGDLDGKYLFKFFDSSLTPDQAAVMLQNNGFEKGINGAYANGSTCWAEVGNGGTINWSSYNIVLR